LLGRLLDHTAIPIVSAEKQEKAADASHAQEQGLTELPMMSIQFPSSSASKAQPQRRAGDGSQKGWADSTDDDSFLSETVFGQACQHLAQVSPHHFRHQQIQLLPQTAGAGGTITTEGNHFSFRVEYGTDAEGGGSSDHSKSSSKPAGVWASGAVEVSGTDGNQLKLHDMNSKELEELNADARAAYRAFFMQVCSEVQSAQGPVTLFSMSPNGVHAAKAQEWMQAQGQLSHVQRMSSSSGASHKNIINVTWSAVKRSTSGGTVISAVAAPANETMRMPLSLALDPHATCAIDDKVGRQNGTGVGARSNALSFVAGSPATTADVPASEKGSSAALEEWSRGVGGGHAALLGHASPGVGMDGSALGAPDDSGDGINPQAVCAPVGPALRGTRLRCYYHFGQLMGLALRSRVPLPLALSPLAWKPLVGETRTTDDLSTVDRNLTVAIECFQQIGELGVTSSNFEDLFDQMYVGRMSDGTEVELVPGGAQQQVPYSERLFFTLALLRTRLRESELQLNAMRSGLYSIVPPHALPLFTWEELELLVCGR
jgi:hypothetical protein